MINRREIPDLEARSKEMIATEGTDESQKVEALVQRVTGPAAGLIYDPDTGHLNLAEGYIFDNAGNVVILDDVTGPGTGMVYRDGKLVPVE